jgi:hypothetical protein
MNSYTVPLNPEETRHATWQGEFKWFIYSLTQRADVIFKEIGTFGEKAFVRMQDAKLFTEIVDAMFYGIRTTNRTMLDSLYRKWDDCFPEKDDFSEYIMAALYKIFDWKEIHNGPLVKPHMIYSLILAVMYLVRPTFPLKDYYPLENPVEIKDDQAILDLSYLADALESENHPTELVSFVDASSSKTNVASNRIERFTTFCRVIS